MATTDDGVLVLAAREGDQHAFGKLFDGWFDRVYDVARRIVHDDGIAAEVTQDAFLRAWTKLDTLQDPDAFGGWVLRIGRNGALNRLQKERRAVSTDDEVLTAVRDRAAAGDEPFEQLDEAGRIALVWEAAAALGERDRSVLDLHLRHGLTPKELAEELGCTPNNAHQVVFTLRKRLGNAIRAFVLYRGGRPTCAALALELRDGGVGGFDAATVKLIDAHVGRCEQCAADRTERVAPMALFAAAPVVAAPLALRSQLARGLSSEGVPMDGSTAAHQPGASGPTDPPRPGTGAVAGSGDAPTASVGGAVSASAGTSADQADEGGDELGDEDDPAPTRRRRALVASGVVLILLAAILLWPRSDDDREQVASSGGTPRTSVATTTPRPTTTGRDRAEDRTTTTGREDAGGNGGAGDDGGSDGTPGAGVGNGEAGGDPGGGGPSGGMSGGAGSTGGGTSGGTKPSPTTTSTSTSSSSPTTTTTTPPPPAPAVTITAALQSINSAGCTSPTFTWLITWTTSNAVVIELRNKTTDTSIYTKIYAAPTDGTPGSRKVCAKEGTYFRLRASGNGQDRYAEDGGDVFPPVL